MPRQSSSRQVLDMYWFAHGGVESSPGSDSSLVRENTPGPTDTEDEGSETSVTCKPAASEEPVPKQCVDRTDSNGRTTSSKRLAVEERKRQILEAEQVKNEAILKKHAEREAALEARRNAQRNKLSFAFGAGQSSSAEFDIAPVQLQPSVHRPAPKAATNDLMSMSMTSSMSYTRGRRKNDLTPTVPFDRTGHSSRPAKGETRKRSVSMSRLDVLAQPRRHYVAQKASSTMSSSSASKDVNSSPKRPLSSASDKSSKSQHTTSNVTRRPQTAARKPRPVSIAGSIPDHKLPPRSSTPKRKTVEQDLAIATGSSNARSSSAKRSTASSQKVISDKHPPVPAKAPLKPGPKPPPKSVKQSTPKTSPSRKLLTNKKQAAMLVATAKDTAGEAAKISKAQDVAVHPVTDEESQSSDEKKQHIISEEEAKAALAEKRRLAREQAEKEAAILKQQEEEQQREREKQQREEEERQQKMEEEQLRLLEEHRRFEEEKLQKAIEEQTRREEEEKIKREEEARLKAEQEKKAKDEAEKQRLELEEKLKKEEEERAERKKRLEKIMSRTRGKSGTASPSGSLNGSEPIDSCENQPLSSDPSSLESNEPLDRSSPTESIDVNQTLYLASQSLSSNDLMLPSSDHTSLDSNIQVFPSEPTSLEPHIEANEEHVEAKSSSTETSDHEQDSQSLPVSKNQHPASEEINDSSQIEDQPILAEKSSENKMSADESTSEPSKEHSQQVEFAGEVEKNLAEHQMEFEAVEQVESHHQEDLVHVEHVESVSVINSTSTIEMLENKTDEPDDSCHTTPGAGLYCGIPGPFQDDLQLIQNAGNQVHSEDATAETAQKSEDASFTEISSSMMNFSGDKQPTNVITSDNAATDCKFEDVDCVNTEQKLSENIDTLNNVMGMTKSVDVITSDNTAINYEFKDMECVNVEQQLSESVDILHEQNMAAVGLSEHDNFSFAASSDVSSNVGLVEPQSHHTLSSSSEQPYEVQSDLCVATIDSSVDFSKQLVDMKVESPEPIVALGSHEGDMESEIPKVEDFKKSEHEESLLTKSLNESFEQHDDEIHHQYSVISSDIVEQQVVDVSSDNIESPDPIVMLCAQEGNTNVGADLMRSVEQEELLMSQGESVEQCNKNDFVEGMVPHCDKLSDDGRNQSNELLQLDPKLSFEELQFPDEKKHLVLTDQMNFSAEVGCSATEVLAEVMADGEVPQQFSITHTMTEFIPQKEINPFSNANDESKLFCNDQIQEYISQQNSNPFASGLDLSNSVYSEITENVSKFNSEFTDRPIPPTQNSPELQNSAGLLTNSDGNAQTQNPFANSSSLDGDNLFLPSGKGLGNVMDYIAEESEDSSLDSNLSQVLHAQPSDIANLREADVPSKSLPNGQSCASSDSCKEVVFCDITTNIPKANGCNGGTYDGRLESVDFHADQPPDTSQVQPYDTGDIPNKNIFLLDDHAKVAPNSFVGVSERNPFSSNPF